MTIDAWLTAAITDAERRGLPDLEPLLETLARATKALRDAELIEPPTDGATRRRTTKRRDDDR